MAGRIVALVCALMGTSLLLPGGAPAQERRPNVLIIVTDDQRLDGMVVMRETRRRFQRGGKRFRMAMTVTPLCCQARASIMTGRYAHNHGVKLFPDVVDFDHSTTLQRHLRDAGYRTAMAGKFLNRFPIGSDPPHFDRWASTTGFHYRYEANVDGEVRQSDGTYQTDFVRDKSVDFLAAFEDSDAQPWFLYAAPFAPHGPPKVPERYRDASVPPFRPTEAHRDKLRDKSRWLRDRVPEPYDARTFRRGQLRMLMAVDEMVGDIFDRLDALGETNTLAVFTSDSGILYGEHKRWGKHWPYPPVHRIPLYLRWPGVIEPGTDRRLAANIDVAPTIADAVGLDMPMVDGHSLLRRYRRRAILVERWAKPRDRRRIPAWALVQTRRHLLLRFYGRRHRVIGQEFYNLARDPHRLRNVWGDRRRGNEPRRRLERRMVRHLREARRCEGGACP